MEGHVKNGVDEGEVGAGGGDDGLVDEHAERAGEDDAEELGEVGGFELARGDDAGVCFGGLFAEGAGAALEEDGGVGLWHDCYQEEGCAGVDEADPEGPAPADCGGGEAGDDGGAEGAAGCCL